MDSEAWNIQGRIFSSSTTSASCSNRTLTEHSVPTLFENQVAKTPDSVALIYQSEKITFAILNARANQLARLLRDQRVGPETIVGHYFSLSIQSVVALMSILKAGGAYLALDLSYPTPRIEEIIKDAGVSLILTSSNLAPKLPRNGIIAICVDLLVSKIAAEADDNLQTKIDPDSTAYITYTSGSTGRPKGVIASHRSITNGLNSLPFDDGLPDEICSLNSSLSFGFSVSRLFLPLFCGITVVVIPEEISKDPLLLVTALEQNRVTSVAIVTPLLREILRMGPNITTKLSRIRTVTVGGALLSTDTIDLFFALLPQARMLNGYASSEVGGAAIVWTYETRLGSKSTVGAIFANTAIYILDESLEPVKAGETGEIYISAPHLSRGYLGQPSLTAEVFIANPLTDAGGDRLFRTGDIARYLVDGQIELLGRKGDMVKIRGNRVELGEIEFELRNIEEVRDAIVTSYEIEGNVRLVAYFVSSNQTVLKTSAIRNYLTRRLPEYMIPTIFVSMDRLPLTPTGKVDLRSLPKPMPARADMQCPYAEPRTPDEAAVADIWARVLGIDQVGINDHFIELGGDSLLAVEVMFHVSDHFGSDIPLNVILTHPTVAQLVAEAKSYTAGEQRESL